MWGIMSKSKGIFGAITKFLKEVKIELSKVNWPNSSELISYTAVVITVVLLVALFIGGVDLVFSNLIKPIILN
jgi:preprotein translocase subunit SecE